MHLNDGLTDDSNWFNVISNDSSDKLKVQLLKTRKKITYDGSLEFFVKTFKACLTKLTPPNKEKKKRKKEHK